MTSLRQNRALRSPTGPVGPAQAAAGWTDRRLDRLARIFCPRPRHPLPAVHGNDVRLLINGNEAFAAMLSAILVAKTSVDVEMYIWRADAIGRRFAELLKAKSAEGVRVRLIYDSVGCWGTPRRFWREMAQAGVGLAEFNPVARWRRRPSDRAWCSLKTLNHRDHRKMVLVDGQVGFTGGVNFADEYAGQGSDSRHWRDTCVRVAGPVVGHMTALFERQWQRVTGQRPVGQPPADPPPAGRQCAIVLGSRPGRTNLIHRTIVTAIRRARRQIEVTMAYFCPPGRLTRALCRAARRGVEVTLILPARSDVEAIFHAGRAHYDRLLRAGVRIFECLGTVLHAKSVQVDGLWGTVGSANLDLRSFRLNDEVNLFVLGRDFAAQLHQMFLVDLARCRQVHLAGWRQRPWRDRIRERFYRLFRRWL